MKVEWFKVHSKTDHESAYSNTLTSPVGKEKVYGGKDLLKSPVLSSEWNTERVREDASGDSKDDELPCVIGESAEMKFCCI